MFCDKFRVKVSENSSYWINVFKVAVLYFSVLIRHVGLTSVVDDSEIWIIKCLIQFQIYFNHMLYVYLKCICIFFSSFMETVTSKWKETLPSA